MFSNTANRFVETFSGNLNSGHMVEDTDELILGLPSTSTFPDLPISVMDIPKSASGRPRRQASSRISDFVAAEVQLRKNTSKVQKITKVDFERTMDSGTAPRTPGNPPTKSADSYPCCYCETVLPNLDQLEQHILTHVKPLPHVCAVCKHSFSARETLTKHMKSHVKQRKFSCPVCPMAFSQRGKLKLHLRTHSGERPYKCTHESCTYAAAQKGNLTVHLRAVHGIL